MSRPGAHPQEIAPRWSIDLRARLCARPSRYFCSGYFCSGRMLISLMKLCGSFGD